MQVLCLLRCKRPTKLFVFTFLAPWLVLLHIFLLLFLDDLFGILNFLVYPASLISHSVLFKLSLIVQLCLDGQPYVFLFAYFYDQLLVLHLYVQRLFQ